MKQKLSIFLGIVLIGGGAVLTGVTALLAPGLPGHFLANLYGGAGLCLAGLVLWLIHPPLSGKALEIDMRETELDRREELLRQKEKALRQKIAIHYEWLEFPHPSPPDEPSQAPELLPDIAEKDAAVAELIEKKSGVLFENLKKNIYYQDNRFQPDLLTRDILDLIEQVARVYAPDSRAPLLETSIENLLRALNRISLQLLVLLEQLPLNIKEYNMRRAYDTVRKGVRAYEVYKSAEPFIPYMTPLYYLGRLGLGASPMTLGAGWAAGELLKRGSRKLSAHLANRYALYLFRELVYVLGNEAAGIFSPEYRYRDRHWIYGAELTELIAAFSVSQKMLSAALNEVGKLALRSEYDRIFLYRCLAAGKSARPERFKAADIFSRDVLEPITERLERFADQYSQADASAREHWRERLYQRMGLAAEPLDLGARLASDSPEKKPPPALAQALAYHLDPQEVPRFAYKGVEPENPPPETVSGQGSCWLVGTSRRLLLFALDKKAESARLLWQGEKAGSLTLERSRGRLKDSCLLIGGRWRFHADQPLPRLWISGRTWRSYDAHFGPLHRFLDNEAPETREPEDDAQG